jgi:hypothetical protein
MKQLLYLILLINFASCKKFEQKNVLYFDKMNFQNKITFGDSSDVIMQAFSKNNITISKVDDNLSINVKDPVYFKIDNVTQNIFDLSSIDAIEYKGYSISKAKLDEQLNKIYSNKKVLSDNQNYLPLKYFLLLFKKSDSIQNIKSIISHDLNKFILLDDDIHLLVNGEKIRYKHKFSIAQNSFKIEFYNPIYYHIYRGNNKDNNYLYVDSISGHTKVVSAYNNFGASEFIVSQTTKGLQVEYDKPYIDIVSKSDLDKLVTANNNLPISLTQNYLKTNDANAHEVKSYSYNKPPIIATWYKGELENPIPELIIKEINILWIFVFFLPLIITTIFVLWRINKSKFISTLYDNSLNFHGNTENTFWLPYLKKLVLIVCGFLLIRGLISYSLFITEPNYHYFLPMQIVMMPFILLIIFNTWNIFNYLNGLKELTDKTKKEMSGLLKKELSIQIIFHVILISILILINKYYFTDILMNQLKFDFKSGLSTFKLATNSSMSPLISLLFMYIVSTLLILFLKSNRSSNLIKWVLIVSLFALALTLKNSYSFVVLVLFLLINGSNFIDAHYLKTLGKINLIERILKFICDRLEIIFAFVSNKLHTKNNFLNFSKSTLDNFNANKVFISKYIASLLLLSGICLWQGDQGYIINLLPLVLGLFWLLSNVTASKNLNMNIVNEQTQKQNAKMNWITGIAFLLFILLAKTYAHYSVNMEGRTSARLTAVYDFNNMEDIGLRKTESISQWFVVMGKYVWPSANVINENEFHSVVSGNTDPIVINDLSFPINISSLFGKGSLLFYCFLILLWVLLFKYVNKSTFTPLPDFNNNTNKYISLHHISILKTAGLFYIIFSGLWLILSYWSLMPFTGRLILGLGQDSAAEVLEFCTIFSVFGFTFNQKTSLN